MLERRLALLQTHLATYPEAAGGSGSSINSIESLHAYIEQHMNKDGERYMLWDRLLPIDNTDPSNPKLCLQQTRRTWGFESDIDSKIEMGAHDPITNTYKFNFSVPKHYYKLQGLSQEQLLDLVMHLQASAHIVQRVFQYVFRGLKVGRHVTGTGYSKIFANWYSMTFSERDSYVCVYRSDPALHFYVWDSQTLLVLGGDSHKYKFMSLEEARQWVEEPLSKENLILYSSREPVTSTNKYRDCLVTLHKVLDECTGIPGHRKFWDRDFVKLCYTANRLWYIKSPIPREGVGRDHDIYIYYSHDTIFMVFQKLKFTVMLSVSEFKHWMMLSYYQKQHMDKLLEKYPWLREGVQFDQMFVFTLELFIFTEDKSFSTVTAPDEDIFEGQQLSPTGSDSGAAATSAASGAARGSSVVFFRGGITDSAIEGDSGTVPSTDWDSGDEFDVKTTWDDPIDEERVPVTTPATDSVPTVDPYRVETVDTDIPIVRGGRVQFFVIPISQDQCILIETPTGSRATTPRTWRQTNWSEVTKYVETQKQRGVLI